MATYKPSAPFSTALVLLQPFHTGLSLGVAVREYYSIEDAIEKGGLFNASFKTYGGTEREVNGLYSIEDTAIVECWYRPDITSECRVAIAGTERVYEVIGEPENIDLRNQYLRFRVRRVKGGA